MNFNLCQVLVDNVGIMVNKNVALIYAYLCGESKNIIDFGTLTCKITPDYIFEVEIKQIVKSIRMFTITLFGNYTFRELCLYLPTIRLTTTNSKRSPFQLGEMKHITHICLQYGSVQKFTKIMMIYFLCINNVYQRYK